MMRRALLMLSLCLGGVGSGHDLWAQSRPHPAPQRVVSLLPSLTETVCALGECARLVGVDRYSNWPQSVQALPHLGGMQDPQLEQLVALRPDLVLLAKSAPIAKRLEGLGIQVVTLEPKTWDETRAVMSQIAALLQVPEARAQQSWRAVQDQVKQAQAQVPAQFRGQKVYFEVSGAPYAASESSFIGGLLQQMHLLNVVPAHLGPFPKLNPEFVVRAQPDLIMMTEGLAQDLMQRPGWANMTAVAKRRVCAFSAREADVLVRPGPRMGEAAQLLLTCLQGLAR
jgi:iron complex transport system substrate-binding protein